MEHIMLRSVFFAINNVLSAVVEMNLAVPVAVGFFLLVVLEVNLCG